MVWGTSSLPQVVLISSIKPISSSISQTKNLIAEYLALEAILKS